MGYMLFNTVNSQFGSAVGFLIRTTRLFISSPTDVLSMIKKVFCTTCLLSTVVQGLVSIVTAGIYL